MDRFDKKGSQLNSTRLSVGAEYIDYDFNKIGKKINSKKNKILGISQIAIDDRSESEVENDIENESENKSK